MAIFPTTEQFIGGAAATSEMFLNMGIEGSPPQCHCLPGNKGPNKA